MITIIFGGVGVGKTKLLTKFACDKMVFSAREDIAKLRKEINILNFGGFNLSFNEKHLVFADYEIIAKDMGVIPRKSHYVSGFYVGLPNSQHKTLFLPPYSSVFFSEGQKYFNSRMSVYFSDFVSRFYETHRHYGVNIFIDCQRPKLIDLNIRELAEEFIEVLSTKDYYKKGVIVKSTWECRVFNSNQSVEKYLTSGDTTDCEYRTYKHIGNIFNCYDSHYFKFLNYKDRYERNFDIVASPIVEFNIESIKNLNDLYNCEVPRTFYTKRSAK